MATGAVSVHRLMLRMLILAGAGIACWAALSSPANADEQPTGLLSGLPATIDATLGAALPPPATQTPAKPDRGKAPERGNQDRPRPQQPKPRPRPPTTPTVIEHIATTVQGVTSQVDATIGQLVETVTALPPEPPPPPPATPDADEKIPTAVPAPTPAAAGSVAVKPMPLPGAAPHIGPNPGHARPRDGDTIAATPRPAYMDLCWPDWTHGDGRGRSENSSTPNADADLPRGWTLSPPTTRAGPTDGVDAHGRQPGSDTPSG